MEQTLSQKLPDWSILVSGDESMNIKTFFNSQAQLQCIYTHIYMHTNTHIHMQKPHTHYTYNTHAYNHTFIYVNTYMQIHLYTYKHIYVQLHTYTYMQTHVYTHIHTHIDIQASGWLEIPCLNNKDRKATEHDPQHKPLATCQTHATCLI